MVAKTETEAFMEMNVMNSLSMKASEVHCFISEQHCFPEWSQHFLGALSFIVSLFLIVQHQACWA